MLDPGNAVEPRCFVLQKSVIVERSALVRKSIGECDLSTLVKIKAIEFRKTYLDPVSPIGLDQRSRELAVDKD